MEILLDKHPALGTAWWVEAVVPEVRREDIARHLIAHLSRFEQRYSRFLPDSLVSRLNTTRELKGPDPEFLEILLYGQSLYTRTFGHFNFLVGNVLLARGYGTIGNKGDPGEIANPQTHLTLSTEKVTLTAGSVDFGGFGKGYVIDELAALLRHLGVEHFLINGGGDLYGTSEPDGTPITIHLEHPTIADTYLGTTTIYNQGFAASSPFKRTWKDGDQTHNHIVGTTTAATFIIAPTARAADAFATACLLASPDEIASMSVNENLGAAHFFPETQEFSAHNFPFFPA